MTTLNQIADGLRTRLETISGLRAYSEPDARPYDPSAEVIDLGRRRASAGATQYATFGIEVSVASDDKGWSESVRKLRPYLDATGTSSIEAAIDGDLTLGGICDWAVVRETGPIRRVEWGDGFRWSGRVIVEVCYDP